MCQLITPLKWLVLVTNTTCLGLEKDLCVCGLQDCMGRWVKEYPGWDLLLWASVIVYSLTSILRHEDDILTSIHKQVCSYQYSWIKKMQIKKLNCSQTIADWQWDCISAHAFPLLTSPCELFTWKQPACSNLIGQDCREYKQTKTQNASDIKILPLANRFWVHT